MALSGYAREHASLSIGSTHRRPRACGESCNDMRVQAEHERLAAQAIASRLKGIEAWSALDSSGLASVRLDSRTPTWAPPLLVTWIEAPLAGLSKRLLGTGTRACEACERLEARQCLSIRTRVCACVCDGFGCRIACMARS